ncbi:uncharacterized protein PAC_14432 [Phialocephala subalpina]|uniref:Arylsulfotransferase n=1 Tax=Phialocephala subalpina TaxID=576137 RepID=A0A1L7XHN6_9HELO|nr:uncharacterized protein PAC_14432 [Phialocephala subalpina]
MHLLYALLASAFIGIVVTHPSNTASLAHRVKARAPAPWPLQSFKTAPFTPPVFNVSKSGASLAPGYLFLTPLALNGAVQSAAVIMTDGGDLIWSSAPGDYTNLVTQPLDSKPVLSYWTGDTIGNNGYGHVSILDETYTEMYRVCPQAVAVTANSSITFPCYADAHESFITNHGSVLISMINVTAVDLSVEGGPKDGYIFDSLFFDVDIKTNKTLFRWSALEAGIPFTDSKALFNGSFGVGSRTDPWDWFHINAVQSIGDGYIVNGRHLWTTFKLNSTGDIEWRITGDTGGDFALPGDGHFAWEHHARVEKATSTDLTLHYMNNFNAAPPFNGSNPSTGLSLHLDLTTNTASVLKNLIDPNENIYNDAQGTFDPQANSNTLLGYGQIPAMKEFGPLGNEDVRMTIWYGIHNNSGPGAQSYRIYRREWVGTPAYDPVVVVQGEMVYMSWNGATGITSWEVFAGDQEQDLKSVGKVPNAGFETMFQLSGSCANSKSVRVAAYRGAELLRYSNIVVVG